MSEDLYEALGLSRSASDAEIKKAYRTLARKYHPDVNKEAGAEDKFKRIQKSYDILSNPKKKSQYDQFGVTDDMGAGGPGAGGFGGFDFGGGFEGGFDDIFDSFFGGSRRSSGQTRRNARVRGEDLRYDLEITLEEAAKGVAKEIDIYHLAKCSTCSGSGSKPGSSKVSCSHCNGRGQIQTVQRTMLGSFSQISTCPACHGEGSLNKNPCNKCAGRGLEKRKKTIKVDIPAGIDGGNKLRVSGEGNFGENGGPAGDLYVFVSIKKHRYFSRKSNDIYLGVNIAFSKAVLGAQIEVPILDGTAKLKIPAGSQSGTVFRLKGKGIPFLRGFGKGDQYVKIHVEVPRQLSGKEKELINAFANLRGENKPQDNIYSQVR